VADQKLKDAVNRISANPAMLDDLISLPPGQRKRKLQDLGIDYKRDDVRKQMLELMQGSGGPVGPDRMVDWVAAGATLAAGALAA
jgi:hypothetical protein